MTSGAFFGGHYVLNQSTLDRGGVPIFGDDGDSNLNGGRPIPADLVMEWKTSFPSIPTSRLASPERSTRSCRCLLPTSPAPSSRPRPNGPPRSAQQCAESASELPSGQQVAGHARPRPVERNPGSQQRSRMGRRGTVWFYILSEPNCRPTERERLGQVGGQIVAEVLVGLLQRDPNSYLYLDPCWKPVPPIAPMAGQFTFVDLLKYAGAPPHHQSPRAASPALVSVDAGCAAGCE